MHIIKRLQQPREPRQTGNNDRDMHKLMAGAKDIKCAPKPPLREAIGIDHRTKEIEDNSQSNAPHREASTLLSPAMSINTMNNTEQRRQRQRAVRAHP